jgi:PTS system beta-glucosides-specific IIC component
MKTLNKGVIYLFGFGKKKTDPTTQLKAPVNGKLIALNQVADAVFAGGAMGKGFGIEPADGQIVAPVAGQITVVADTKHAVGIKTADGVEALLHLGIDTVGLSGKGFEVYVTAGQKIKAGQQLVEMDLDVVAAAKLKTTVILVITNSADLGIDLDLAAAQQVTAGQPVATIEKE